jgi:hypothetical protein
VNVLRPCRLGKTRVSEWKELVQALLSWRWLGRGLRNNPKSESENASCCPQRFPLRFKIRESRWNVLISSTQALSIPEYNGGEVTSVVGKVPSLFFAVGPQGKRERGLTMVSLTRTLSRRCQKRPTRRSRKGRYYPVDLRKKRRKINRSERG